MVPSHTWHQHVSLLVLEDCERTLKKRYHDTGLCKCITMHEYKVIQKKWEAANNTYTFGLASCPRGPILE